MPDLHRVRLDIGARAPRPKVSVVVPNRNAFRLFSQMAEGLYEATDYPDFELIVVDNGSTDPDTLALYDKLKREHAEFHARHDAGAVQLLAADQSRRGAGARARRSCCSITTSR